MAVCVLNADFRGPRSDNSAYSRIHRDGNGRHRVAVDAPSALRKESTSSLTPKFVVKTTD